jgi:two-component system chemotaxis sensor kinase CheA
MSGTAVCAVKEAAPWSARRVNDLQDIVKDFLVESYENLDQLDRDLVRLEQDPSSADELGSIFRTIHTIKGTCGFLGFDKLQSVAHAGENLLSKLRDRELTLRPDITTGLLSLVDAIRQILANIENLGAEGEADYCDLIQALTALQAEPINRPDSDEPLIDLDRAPEVSNPVGYHSSVSDGTIRVDVGLLDKLMNRVGELVLARNQILQFTNSFSDTELHSAAQRLNLITTELQEGVMKTRLQPIGNLWSKFPRIVRDLALHCGKEVRIEMDGKETELDKTIIESIKDPLTHIVRNAIDHGIESAAERLAAGKPAESCLRLRAFHEGGQVNIEVSDDGRGLDLARIRQKAIDRGLITSDQAPRMSDREVTQLIFTAGFSTAAQVTSLSGRGVGMDVVKNNVEKIGGIVDVSSQPGQGTTVKLKIPLTLAIIPALIVTCGGDRFAIPQVNLLELVRLAGDQDHRGIENLHGAPVYRLRGQLLPIVYLCRELGLNETTSTDEDEAINIVVLQADHCHFGLVVDSITDTEEIVVKPLSPQLKSIPVYAGATIMGDGKVALILDVLGMAQRAHVVGEVHNQMPADDQRGASETPKDRHTLLVVKVGNRRLALMLSMVSRLEEIPTAAIEQAAGREVVQYRGQILPLVRLGPLLGVTNDDHQTNGFQVVVYSERGQSVGLVVDRIDDVVDSSVEAFRRTQCDALFGSAIIQGRVTDLLDLPTLIHRAVPAFFDDSTSAKGVLA